MIVGVISLGIRADSSVTVIVMVVFGPMCAEDIGSDGEQGVESEEESAREAVLF